MCKCNQISIDWMNGHRVPFKQGVCALRSFVWFFCSVMSASFLVAEYEADLEDHITSDTTGYYQRMLVVLLQVSSCSRKVGIQSKGYFKPWPSTLWLQLLFFSMLIQLFEAHSNVVFALVKGQGWKHPLSQIHHVYEVIFPNFYDFPLLLLPTPPLVWKCNSEWDPSNSWYNKCGQ